jgi:hypothetical protein
MAFFLYASFPNSQNRQRPGTRNAVTYQKVIFDYTLPLTLVATENTRRIYIVLRNLSSANSFWYVYARPVDVDPSVVPTFGLFDDCVYLTTTNTLYKHNSEGLNTDWEITTIQDQGERVEPLQSANLESPEHIWCAIDSAIAVPGGLTLGIDEGFG